MPGNSRPASGAKGKRAKGSDAAKPAVDLTGQPCTACGKPLSKGAVLAEPFTGLPATPPAGKPFHAKCRPEQRMAACYVCHMAAPDDFDALTEAGWACANCGGEVVTIAWGRAEYRPKAA